MCIIIVCILHGDYCLGEQPKIPKRFCEGGHGACNDTCGKKNTEKVVYIVI